MRTATVLILDTISIYPYIHYRYFRYYLVQDHVTYVIQFLSQMVQCVQRWPKLSGKIE